MCCDTPNQTYTTWLSGCLSVFAQPSPHHHYPQPFSRIAFP